MFIERLLCARHSSWHPGCVAPLSTESREEEGENTSDSDREVRFKFILPVLGKLRGDILT